MKISWLYRFLRPIFTFLMKLLFRPIYIGLENIPKEGRVVLAGNHTGYLDCGFLISSTKRTVHFLAKKQLLDARIKKSMHKLENTAEISKTKRLIAQAKTVIKEKEVSNA